MFDFSDVVRFAGSLADAAETSDIEQAWKRDQAVSLADEIDPPVDTGTLAASITPTDEGVAMVDYWVYPEFGTSRMAPRPFVRPAVNRRLEPAAEDLGERAVREIIL